MTTRSPHPPIVYSIREAMSVSSLGRTFLYSKISSNEIETVKVGNRRLVNAASLQRFLEQGT